MLSSENVIIMENTTSEGQDLMMKKIPRHLSKIFKALICAVQKTLISSLHKNLRNKW